MPLAWRLWIFLMVPIALALSAYGWFAHRSRQQVLLTEASLELRSYGTLVEAAMQSAVGSGDIERVRTKIQSIARAERILGIAMFDGSGDAIYATVEVESAGRELAEVARRALAAKTEVEEKQKLARGTALVRTVTFAARNEGPLVAVVVRDLAYVDTLAETLDRGLVLTGIAMLLILGVIAAWVGRTTVGRPTGIMVAAAERVAGGDLTGKVPEVGALELARLAHSFNAMTMALADARADIERQAAARLTLERRLQQSLALAAAGQVAAAVAHEIGSPLNVILGRARRAARSPDCSDTIGKELESIADQSERITRVVRRLLDVARAPAVRALGSADLKDVVDEAVAFLGPVSRERGIQTVAYHGDRPGVVPVDRDQLFQVVFNLCMNAIEAQPKGGLVALRVCPGNDADDASSVVLEVEDRGPGVPVESREQVFEPFFTTKGAEGGTGLGLAIVSDIVREAGGNVDISTPIEGGARFRVTFPIASELRGQAPRRKHPDAEVA